MAKMTQPGGSPHLSAALLAEKTREASELRLRCSQQENQITRMSRMLQLTRDENRELRVELSLAISKFDEYKEQNEDYAKFVAKCKQRINSLLEQNKEYQRYAAQSKQRINSFLDSLEDDD